MRCVFRARFDVRRREAADLGLRDVRFAVPAGAGDAGTRPSFVTTGLSGYASTGGPADDLTEAARHALRNMLDHLVHAYGFTRQQAYALASVAVDLRVGQVVDSPNHLATAILPTDVITGGAGSAIREGLG
jgi:formamidase